MLASSAFTGAGRALGPCQVNISAVQCRCTLLWHLLQRLLPLDGRGLLTEDGRSSSGVL